MNPNAIHLLEQNQGKIDWRCLSVNPNAIHLLEQNRDKINWYYLAENPNAIHLLLEQNPDKINWVYLSMNSPTSIFTYDYDAMKHTRYSTGLVEKLMQNRFHPKNIHHFEDWGFDPIC